MSALFTHFVRHRIVCGLCDATDEREHKLYSGCVEPYPVLPEGWNTWNGLPVCGTHKVEIDGVVRGGGPSVVPSGVGGDE